MEGMVIPDASTTRYSGISKDMTMIANPEVVKTEEDSYTLAFAAQIDQSLSSGQYMNSVMISVVANPATINDLNDLIYMQDMTHQKSVRTLKPRMGLVLLLLVMKSPNNSLISVMARNTG